MTQKAFQSLGTGRSRYTAATKLDQRISFVLSQCSAIIIQSTFLLAFPHLQLQLYIFNQRQEALFLQNSIRIFAVLLILFLRSSADRLWGLLLVSWPLPRNFLTISRNTKSLLDIGSTLEEEIPGLFFISCTTRNKKITDEPHLTPRVSQYMGKNEANTPQVLWQTQKFLKLEACTSLVC